MAYVAMVFLRDAIKRSTVAAEEKTEMYRKAILPAYFWRGLVVTRLHFVFQVSGGVSVRIGSISPDTPSVSH
jgi:hypothetical protein